MATRVALMDTRCLTVRRRLIHAGERHLTLAPALLGLGATAAIVLAPGVHFAYRSPAGHAALETAAALIGFLAAYLLRARFRVGAVASDLWLAAALGALALANLLFAVIPALTADASNATLSWARAFTDTAALLLFAGAAWLPLRPLRDQRAAEQRAAAIVCAIVVGSLIAALALRGVLPAPIDPALSPESSMRPQIAGALLVEVAQLVAAAALLVASIGFARRADRQQDAFFRWLSAAAAVGVVARVQYFLFPSLFSPWLHTGDFLRLGYYLIILVASLREISRYQPLLAQAAVLEERRRIARDLHDGLAQELAFIAGGLRSIEDDPPDRDEIAQLLDAADQALAESRHAISALSARPDEPLAVAVKRVASTLSLRAGVEVTVAVDENASATPPVREAVLRITREAVTNALRHGAANHVNVDVYCNGGVRLTVRDDGSGFEPLDEPHAAAIGLASMRERAEALGGSLDVRSGDGCGTTVVAELPR